MTQATVTEVTEQTTSSKLRNFDVTRVLLWVITAICMFFLVRSLYALLPRKTIEFKPGSFTAASVTDITDYQAYTKTETAAKRAPQNYAEFAKRRQPPVYTALDVVTVWLDYCKYINEPADMSVTQQSEELDYTAAAYVPRRSDLEMGCHTVFYQLENVQQGTIPGRYHQKITFIYAPSPGAPITLQYKTTDFVVVAPTE